MFIDEREFPIDDTEALATTIGLYALGEISLGKAAERADVTCWEMMEFLSEDGVAVRLGPQSMDDLEATLEEKNERLEELEQENRTLRERLEISDELLSEPLNDSYSS